MEQKVFENHLMTIMQEEGWQNQKGRTIKTCLKNQRSAINAIARALGLEKLSLDDISELGCYY